MAAGQPMRTAWGRVMPWMPNFCDLLSEVFGVVGGEGDDVATNLAF